MERTSSTVMGEPFCTEVRVYYEDTDAGGVVYHTNYIKYMERARTEFLRNLGYGQHELAQQGQIFVVADCSVQFRKSACLDDVLTVTSEIESVGKVRLVFRQKIFRHEELLCEGRFVIGCVNRQTMRPEAIYEELRKKCL